MGRPVVYTETLLGLLKKVIKEVHQTENEWVVIDRTDLFRDDDDLMNLGRIQIATTEIHNKLYNGYLTADQGIEMIRDRIMKPYHNLISRLTESQRFPELYALYNICQ